MSPSAATAGGKGSDGPAHFAIALRLALAALAAAWLLQLALHLRPGPYGGPFLLEWRRYLPLALYYEMLGVWLVSAPFLVLWLVRYRRPTSWGAALHRLQALSLTLYLLLSQLDHEILRFLGIRLGFSFIATYVRPETASDSLFYDLLVADAGGPLLPVFLLVAVPGAYGWWAWRQAGRTPPLRLRLPFWAAILLALVPLAAPANGWRQATSQFRLRKVEPVVIALAVDARLGFGDLETPPDLARLAADHQARWLADSADKGWRFPDPQLPYLRVPTTAQVPEAPWNVVLIQLETMRGIDVGFLNPDRRPSPTPYLDRLAQSGEAAAFTRALSFGQPSINGLFAAHCSVAPHSRRYVTAFVGTALLCLPELLRARGYRAEMFNAGDTDWDGATPWLDRWYDRLWRFPEAREHDRPVFRAAAARIRSLGRSGRPFLAAIVSVSNHTPFRSREPGFDIAGQGSSAERILNTTRYTDDVVRELVETLRGEPLFARTIFVLYGDHGFNLGEHDGRAGEQNLYRESLWVPLIFVGRHPRLAAGLDSGPASLLDVAPTLADLLGIRIANPWLGHSLLARSGPGWVTMAARDTALAEAGGRTALTDSATGETRLFDRSGDWLQRRPLAGERPLAEALIRRARDAARLNDHLLRRNLVRPAREQR